MHEVQDTLGKIQLYGSDNHQVRKNHNIFEPLMCLISIYMGLSCTWKLLGNKIRAFVGVTKRNGFHRKSMKLAKS